MLSRIDIRIPAILISLLLSAWAVYSALAINNDGIVYVASAERLLQGDWEGAYRLYNWPLYSGLIALIGKLSGFNLELSAQIVNAFFSAALAYVFITLVRDLGADRKTLWIAAFVILFHPYINDSREEIIRDHGYWSLYLLAILYFFRYRRKPSWGHAIAWSAAMGAATLFRIEGLAFLFLLPVVLLVSPPESTKPGALLLFRASAMALTLLVVLAVLSLVQPDFYTSWAGRLEEPGYRIHRLWTELTAGLVEKSEVIRSSVLPPWSQDYALPLVYTAIVLILVDKTIRTLTPLYSILPFVPKLRTRFNPPSGMIPVLAWLLILNIAIVVVFLISELFISSRYVVPLVLTLLTMTPFLLSSLHDQWVSRRSLSVAWRISFPVTLLLLVFMTGDGLVAFKGSNRTYLRDAGEWIQQNLPTSADLFTNDQMVHYYTGREITTRDMSGEKSHFRWLKNDQWKRYRYLAIAINRYTKPEHSKQVAAINAKVLKRFQNIRGEHVLILERPQ